MTPTVTKAVVSGSFDPITRGHLYVIDQARKMADEVIVLVANNPDKRYHFSIEARKEIIEQAIDVLVEAGIPLQEDGKPCGGVACALWFQDEDALDALLGRGAEWEGLELDERGRALLERQPAWRRRALGGIPCGTGEEDTDRRQL